MDALYCNDSSQHHVDVFKTVKSSVPLSFVSSILSILGSLSIIITFILWKDVRRSTARVLLLFLAIADLGTGISYLVAVIGFEGFRLNDITFNNATYDYKIFCQTQSFFTTFFPVSSFFWTSVMGLYFLVALVFRRPRWGPKLMIILNIIGWGAPAIFLSAMVSLGFLGPFFQGTVNGTGNGNYSYPVSAAWCFVSNNDRYHIIRNSPHSNTLYWVFEGICGKFWEFLAVFIIVICYGIILVSHRRCCQVIIILYSIALYLLFSITPLSICYRRGGSWLE